LQQIKLYIVTSSIIGRQNIAPFPPAFFFETRGTNFTVSPANTLLSPIVSVATLSVHEDSCHLTTITVASRPTNKIIVSLGTVREFTG
jgi:hypothetical protein